MCIIITVVFSVLITIGFLKAYQSHQNDLAKSYRVFQSSQTIADDINEWYAHSLSDKYYVYIPNSVSRRTIDDAYPLLNFEIFDSKWSDKDLETMPIYNQCIYIFRHLTKKKTEC